VDSVRHPVTGHTVLYPEQVQAFLGWLAEMDNPTLFRQAKTWRWLAETRGWTEFVWRWEQCRAELERRKLSI
jgi:hypothetical protein